MPGSSARAAPEPGVRRRTKAEYELIAARLDGQSDLLNKQPRALSTPELPDALTAGDLAQEWPALPFLVRRRIVETLIARVTLLPVGRAADILIPAAYASTGHSERSCSVDGYLP
jgi:hypothetical protein